MIKEICSALVEADVRISKTLGSMLLIAAAGQHQACCEPTEVDQARREPEGARAGGEQEAVDTEGTASAHPFRCPSD